MKAISLCVNLKADDLFLPYNIPEVFNEIGHGLTDIVTALDEFKPVLTPECFWNNDTYIYCVL